MNGRKEAEPVRNPKDKESREWQGPHNLTVRG